MNPSVLNLRAWLSTTLQPVPSFVPQESEHKGGIQLIQIRISYSYAGDNINTSIFHWCK